MREIDYVIHVIMLKGNTQAELSVIKVRYFTFSVKLPFEIRANWFVTAHSEEVINMDYDKENAYIGLMVVYAMLTFYVMSVALDDCLKELYQ